MYRRAIFDNPGLKLMLYGAAGSTKTRTAATAAADPRTSPCLMLEMGGNPVSIRQYEKKPDVISCDALDDFNPFYNWLAGGQKLNDPIVGALGLHPPYKCVIIDGMTEVQRYAFAIVTGAKDTKPGTIPATAEIQHFNKTLGLMINFARLFIKLPLHVIITSLEAEKPNSQGTNNFRPLLWGQAAGEVAGFPYMVMRLVHRTRLDAKTLASFDEPLDPKAPIVSVGLLKQAGTYYAKDQYGTGLTQIIEPSITKILDAIEAAGSPINLPDPVSPPSTESEPEPDSVPTNQEQSTNPKTN